MPGPGKLSRWHLQNCRFCNLHVTQKAHTLAETDGEKWQTKMSRSLFRWLLLSLSFSVVAERPLASAVVLSPAVIRSVAAIPGRRGVAKCTTEKAGASCAMEGDQMRSRGTRCNLQAALRDRRPNPTDGWLPHFVARQEQTFSILATPGCTNTPMK